jgi:hypothetical protein
MNAVQANDYNQTVSTKTASYTLVAADKGTRVVMNSASATTITVNTSLFSAGDTLFLQNIGAGVCTVTAGTATVSSAGPLAIPQNGSGTLYFTSAGVSLYYPSAVTANPGGLTLISATTIGTTVSTVTVSSAFSSTYDNYNIVITGGVGSTNSDIALTLGASATGYFAAYSYVNIGTSATAIVTNNNASSFSRVGQATTTQISANLWLQNPFAAATTMLQGAFGRTVADNVASYVGGHSVASSFTAFTLTPSTGTLTGGTIRVYGYANS